MPEHGTFNLGAPCPPKTQLSRIGLQRVAEKDDSEGRGLGAESLLIKVKATLSQEKAQDQLKGGRGAAELRSWAKPVVSNAGSEDARDVV